MALSPQRAVVRAWLMLGVAWAGETLAAPAPALPSFTVRVGSAAETLTVEASFPAGTAGPLVLEDGGERFLRDVQLEQAGRWVASPASDQGVRLPACGQGCRVRYRFLLRDAAQALDNPQSAAAVGTALVSPPSLWLLHPGQRAVAGYRLSVTAPEGLQAVCGLAPTAESDTYQSTAGLRVAPLCAFGPWRVHRLEVGAARVTLAIAPVSFAMGDDELERWVAEAMQAL